MPKFNHRRFQSVGNAEIRQAYKAYVDARIVAPGLEPPDDRTGCWFL